MHLQSKSGEIESNPVFIPKRMQTQTKRSFVANGYQNKFRNKEISVNGSLLPNSNFKTKPIKPLKSGTAHTIPIKAEIHQQIGGHQKQLTETNGSDSVELLNNMTAIKSILKTRTSDSVANGAISQVANQSDDQTIISEYNLTKHKTHNQDSIIGNMKNTGTSRTTPRRKSSNVQFDIHNIKESTRVELNSNTTRGLASISSARRESSNSSSSLSIIQQSVPQNQALTYDFPKSSQRMSDLRKILNPEIEKEDSLKKLGDRLIHCDCFELNLNNAAKIISALVLLATFILVIRALFQQIY